MSDAELVNNSICVIDVVSPDVLAMYYPQANLEIIRLCTQICKHRCTLVVNGDKILPGGYRRKNFLGGYCKKFEKLNHQVCTYEAKTSF